MSIPIPQIFHQHFRFIGSTRRHAKLHPGRGRLRVAGVLALLTLGGGPAVRAQAPAPAPLYTGSTPDLQPYGPYAGSFVAGGEGLAWPLRKGDLLLRATAPWSLSAWVESTGGAATAGTTAPATLIAGFGAPGDEDSRYIGLADGKLMLRLGANNVLSSSAPLDGGGWHLLAASSDGVTLSLFLDGKQVASGKLALGEVEGVLEMAPPRYGDEPPSPGEPFASARYGLPGTMRDHFAGRIAGLTLARYPLTSAAAEELFRQRPDFTTVSFEEASKGWPVQTRGQAGYRAPQDPSILPRSAAPFSKPVARPAPAGGPALKEDGARRWILDGNWKLTPAPKVSADAATLSRAGFDTEGWMAATVPGTVLTTMIDRGIYPDPDYGLNNLAIPESLNQQDYWYRTEFTVPPGSASAKNQRLTLTFEGINYAAEVWLNGRRLGSVTGAFIRGVFDVTEPVSRSGPNALAVRISPPPHPGIPNEQSVRGGPGENGGLMCLDGPTFVATEGWDWIPAIRDRDSGIWQNVTLTATGTVSIGDPQVVTKLPLPDISRADVEITVPLRNPSDKPVEGTLSAAFEQVNVSKHVTIAPGESAVKLAPAEFAQLALGHPRLWWPNGYGKPELYQLKLSFRGEEGESDTRQLRFGVREVTYELSLFDSQGRLRRVEVSPTEARALGRQVVDVTHNGMREIPRGWVSTLLPGAEATPAVVPASDTGGSTDLVIKVNGVRIAARGGNWGMDDSRKRVSREHLEPFFRLHRDANLNIIRNWVGQNTEAAFYDLADEYGQMVWNDFWDSTQDYNVEAQDPALFLANARDTLLRFRNHPSVVLWCGRNEGVPQPILNEGLDTLIRNLDGTRYYSPSSNRVNLRDSGPYKYRDPALYYTAGNLGFSVELGTPSMSTLESFRSSTAPADQWPVNDVWAYHDWHQQGNGDVAPFNRALAAEFGAPVSLEDFERKAQMLNYVNHRAIFEGFNQHLWAPNSGRMLWMTQPAWPSTMWQILSSDYDTQASFYGVKKACEPIHVQLDLSNYDVAVVNTTTQPTGPLTLHARVYALDGRLLLTRDTRVAAAADALAPGFRLELGPLFASGVVLVKLELAAANGTLVSNNFYWLAADNAAYRQLNTLPQVALTATATTSAEGNGEDAVHLRLTNPGRAVALAAKLTLLHAGPRKSREGEDTRILPAYYSDNYISLLPGESRDVVIRYPAASAGAGTAVALRGWNITPATVAASR